MFLKYRCISCHSADPNARAPVLEELYGKPVHLRDGRTVIADEDYLRESILAPGAKIVTGWENIMPTFQGQVSEEEINELVAFIKSLKRARRRARRGFPPPTAHAAHQPAGGRNNEHDHRTRRRSSCRRRPQRTRRRTI